MQDVLRVCRAYGHGPEWWDGLPRGSRALLLADQRIRDRSGSA